MWEYAKTDEEYRPCTNSECEFYDNDDPDGFNCHLIYLPSRKSCDRYKGE